MADALDRLLPADELGPFDGLSMPELRRRRASLQASEQALSYVRRLAQGRLDIVQDDLQHRRDGTGPRDAAALIADLPRILSEHVGGTGRGSHPEVPAPGDAVDEAVAELDHIVDATALGSLTHLSDDEVAELAARLGEFERRVSSHRKTLHAAIDAIQDELLRRYKTGEASVDAFLP